MKPRVKEEEVTIYGEELFPIKKGSIQRFINHIDTMLIDRVKEDVFYLPTVGTLERYVQTFTPAITKEYDAKIQNGEHVDPRVKVRQVLLNEGLLFGFNVQTEKLALYSANTEILATLNVSIKESDILERNTRGALHAFRIDLEHETPTQYRAKATRLNKNTELNVDHNNWVFIPYSVSQRLTAFLQKFLSLGRVSKITVDYRGTKKLRFISQDEDVLGQFCQDEGFIKSLQPSFYPLEMVAYLPVVGAPSTTSGVTRIEYDKIDQLRHIRKNSPTLAKEIEVADDSPEQIALNNVLGSYVHQLFASDDIASAQLFVNNIGAIGVELPPSLSPGMISASITRAPSKIRNEVFYLLPEAEKERAKRIAGEFKISRLIENPKTEEELKALTENALLRILTITKSGSRKSLVVTNNKDILSRVYGPDYVGRFESQGVRERAFVEAVMQTGEFEENARKFELVLPLREGRDIDEYLTYLQEHWEANRSNRSYSPSGVSVRQIYGTRNETSRKVVDYYANIDPKTIISTVVLQEK